MDSSSNIQRYDIVQNFTLSGRDNPIIQNHSLLRREWEKVKEKQEKLRKDTEGDEVVNKLQRKTWSIEKTSSLIYYSARSLIREVRSNRPGGLLELSYIARLKEICIQVEAPEETYYFNPLGELCNPLDEERASLLLRYSKIEGELIGHYELVSSESNPNASSESNPNALSESNPNALDDQNCLYYAVSSALPDCTNESLRNEIANAMEKEDFSSLVQSIAIPTGLLLEGGNASGFFSSFFTRIVPRGKAFMIPSNAFLKKYQLSNRAEPILRFQQRSQEFFANLGANTELGTPVIPDEKNVYIQLKEEYQNILLESRQDNSLITDLINKEAYKQVLYSPGSMTEVLPASWKMLEEGSSLDFHMKLINASWGFVDYLFHNIAIIFSINNNKHKLLVDRTKKSFVEAIEWLDQAYPNPDISFTLPIVGFSNGAVLNVCAVTDYLKENSNCRHTIHLILCGAGTGNLSEDGSSLLKDSLSHLKPFVNNSQVKLSVVQFQNDVVSLLFGGVFESIGIKHELIHKQSSGFSNPLADHNARKYFFVMSDIVKLDIDNNEMKLKSFGYALE